MTGSTIIYLRPKQANYIFESGDRRKIFLKGEAEHESFSKDMEFFVDVQCVDDDFNEVSIKIPDVVGSYSNAEETCYGDFNIWLDIDVPKIAVRIPFRPQDFERLVNFIDKCFFSSNATMEIHFTIAKVGLGYEPELDKIPVEEQLPIIGYTFILKATKVML
jgi:hypothetical protein